MNYLIICVLILQILIPIFCVIFYIHLRNTRKKIRIESFYNKQLDSETKRFESARDRSGKGTHTTFLNFHFHAADAGFLLIGDFLLQWGLGGEQLKGQRSRTTGDFVRSFHPSKGMGVVTMPIGSGGGQSNLRVRGIGKDYFRVKLNPCEHPYFFLAYGFVSVKDHEMGVKITYNKNQEKEFPKRLQFLADTKGSFRYNYIVNPNNNNTLVGGC